MSLRPGVSSTEEHKLKGLISKGVTWDEICARCEIVDAQGRDQNPLLADVDLAVVKKTIYEPLVKKLEEAKKAGFKTIHDHESDIKKRRDAIAAARKSKELE